MSNINIGKIGEISNDVINTLGLSVKAGTPVYIGESNINHMMKTHNGDYIKYGTYISQIISTPDYVGINPKDNSIEYVKEFPIDNDFVKVAVRISTSRTYFARSVYVLNSNRVSNFITKGSLKPLTKSP